MSSVKNYRLKYKSARRDRHYANEIGVEKNIGVVEMHIEKLFYFQIINIQHMGEFG